MNTDDKIITFESYYDPMLAHIIRTRLEANGIPCFIADENTIGANPLYSQAIGGVKLKIFERDLERCREILATEGDLHEQDHFEIDNETNTYVVCPYCASTNVINIAAGNDPGFLDSLTILLNPFQAQKNWHCNNCQQDFE
jgi:Putative prokaryotic signal transducing protein